jgi:Tfp pilus assembly protein PilN
MRPVNLIPPEQRRGQGAPSRTGSIAPFLVVGVLALALAGVTALVLTNNHISDRKAEIADLKRQSAELKARAERVSSYSQFRDVRAQRTATVASLAESRFDWERVLRELALILPKDVWLVNATGTVAPGVQPLEGAEIATRETVTGPALELIGCAPGQESVARFVAALYDIDGVTRVGVSTSELPDRTETDITTVGNSDNEDCRTRDFISRFEIVVAFDAAAAETVPEAPAPAPAPAGAAPVASETASVQR